MLAPQGLPEGARESKTKLEERSEFKLAREKAERKADKDAPGGGGRAGGGGGGASLGKRPGNPFALADPERVSYQLYKIDKSGGVRWVKVAV